VELHRVEAGVATGSGPRVSFVHGFTQTGASWRHVVGLLAPDHQLVSVDAPGHGGSSDLTVDLATGAEVLGDTVGRAVYVGYSMGGRLALRLALDRPELVSALVLIGATAGIDDAAERADRRRSDDALADRITAIGVDAFLDEWLSRPLFAGLPDDPDERSARRTNTAHGLAESLRLAGTGTMDPPWWDELSHLDVPVVVVAGAVDTKFSALGRRLATSIGPNASFVSVPGAGHAAHLHDPAAVARIIREVTGRPLQPDR
jgi:2-succinyl-6-hydroxy-2,4-cyclohexadiene-1-carboxylate synthase